MSDTPRTDAAKIASYELDIFNGDAIVPVSFARKLERENAALRADRDRLDALQRNKWLVQWTGYNWYVSSPKGKYFPDIRQAIDAARESEL